MEGKQILCVGHVNWDVTVHAGTIPDPDHSETVGKPVEKIGGSSANTAIVLSSLGHNVGVVSELGDDEYGEKARRKLEETGITPYVSASETGTTGIIAVITDDASPRYFAFNEETGEISLSSVPDDVWEETDHVHVTSFHEEIAGQIAQTASAEGKTVSFNPSQGYETRGPFPDVVDAADIVFLNDEEAGNFRNWHNFGEQASDKIIVITHGSAGSNLYAPDTGVYNHTGYNMSEVVDTVGAGDSFVAGFLTEWLTSCSQGEIDVDSDEDEDAAKTRYLRALSLGNACGALSVTREGAPDDLTLEEVYSIING